MEPILISEIASACDGKFFGLQDILKKTTTQIRIDSRQVTAGDVFIAVIGDKLDGHNYIDKAIENGAVCVISEKQLDDKPHILVESTFTALKDIAEYYRGKFDIPVIGITGSVGKTTVKEMVYSVLSQKYKVLKTQGNFNNEFGLPQMIFNIDNTHEVAVLEMGMNNFGEISRLSKTARPDMAVIINVGESHIGNLGSRDGILKAKCEIFDYLKPDGKVFLNGDDDKLITLKGDEHNPVFFGNDQTNDIYVKTVLGADENGTDIIVCYKGEDVQIYIPKPGGYMIYPTLAAIAIAKELKLSDGQIIEGVARYEAIGSRNKIIKTDKLTIVDDAYNACKESIIAGVESIKDIKTEGKKVAIIGDVFELGEFSERIHSEIGKELLNQDVDLCICVGKDSIFIDKAMKEVCNNKSIYFENQDEMIEELDELIEQGDVVYIKASRGMKFENTVSYLKQL